MRREDTLFQPSRQDAKSIWTATGAPSKSNYHSPASIDESPPLDKTSQNLGKLPIGGVMLRSVITALVLALPVLLVVFAVLMAAFGLSTAVGDAAAARVLWWGGMSCLILLTSDLILLIAAIGAVVVGIMDRPAIESSRVSSERSERDEHRS
ncbi:MAG: hypothetical protein KDA59_20410 [Planctomycetales bacterium]|nr:hypothetical protein [Planctomycetales bacterium]